MRVDSIEGITMRCGMGVEDMDAVKEVISEVNGLARDGGSGWYMIAGEA